jgi:hypothetical protein
MLGTMSDGGARFPIRFTGANKAMVVLGMTPRTCYVDVTTDVLDVRFGWAFRCRARRSSITSIVDDTAPVWGWGAHGWRHVWLINGSSDNLLRIDLEPMARGRLLLLFPLRIRALRVGVVEPEALRAALGFGDGRPRDGDVDGTSDRP